MRCRLVWLIAAVLMLGPATAARADVYDENDDDGPPGTSVPLTCRAHPRIGHADPQLRTPAGSLLCEGFIMSAVPGDPRAAPTDKFHAVFDVSLGVPAANGVFPLTTYAHGFGNNKNDGLAVKFEGPLLAEGIAYMRFSARGFGLSHGDSQLLDEDFEVRDVQNLIKAVVEKTVFAVAPSFEIDRKKLAVVGHSYGGGHTLGTAQTARRSWPCGPDTCELVTAIPAATWTDLVYSLVPNGRPYMRYDDPNFVIGVLKFSYVAALFGQSQQFDPRYNGPSYAPLYYRYASAFMAGEPYQVPTTRAFLPTTGPVLSEALRVLSVDRSAAYQDFCSNGPIPIFFIQGWTDDLFTAHEAVRLRDVLDRQCGGQYPLKLYLGNSGHPRGRTSDPEEQTHIVSIGIPWLRYYLLGTGSPPSFDVSIGVTPPPGAKFDPSAVVTVPEVEDIARGRIEGKLTGPVSLSYAPGPVTTVDFAAEPVSSFATNDAMATLSAGFEDGSQIAAPLTGEAIVYSVSADSLIPAGSNYTTVCGFGSVKLAGTVAGTDVQYAVRVWDLDPAKRRVLVDRGVYRFLGSPGPLDITIPLNGNVWRLLPKHQLLIEITNNDFPYLRPNNLASVTQFSGATATLPICEGAVVKFEAAPQEKSRLAATGPKSAPWVGAALLLGGVLLMSAVRLVQRSS